MKLFFHVPVVSSELFNGFPEIEMEIVSLSVSRRNAKYIAEYLERRLYDCGSPIEHGIRFVPSIDKQINSQESLKEAHEFIHGSMSVPTSSNNIKEKLLDELDMLVNTIGIEMELGNKRAHEIIKQIRAE
jgi:hypothetical protein